jgi:hypothetical protein
MKGPKLVKYYSCESCEYLIHSSHCSKTELNQGLIYDKQTPNDCPYIISKKRKEKLEQINNLQPDSLFKVGQIFISRKMVKNTK